MEHVGDHPAVKRCLDTGYPYGEYVPHCPVCGDECTVYYKDRTGYIVGCDECLSREIVEG